MSTFDGRTNDGADILLFKRLNAVRSVINARKNFEWCAYFLVGF